MISRNNSSKAALPAAWARCVKSAMLHVLSLAQYASAYPRSWAADSWNADLPPENGSRPCVRIMPILDLKGRSVGASGDLRWRSAKRAVGPVAISTAPTHPGVVEHHCSRGARAVNMSAPPPPPCGTQPTFERVAFGEVQTAQPAWNSWQRFFTRHPCEICLDHDLPRPSVRHDSFAEGEQSLSLILHVLTPQEHCKIPNPVDQLRSNNVRIEFRCHQPLSLSPSRG